MRTIFLSSLISFHKDEYGTTNTEYVILLVLVALTIIAIIKTYGRTTQERYYWGYQRTERFVTIN